MPTSEVVVVGRGTALVRILRSIHEPRAVTALVVALYGLLGLGLAVWIPVSPGPTPPLQGLAVVPLMMAGVVGMPSAWTGWRGVERYALAALALGWVLLGVEDLAHAIDVDALRRTPGVILIAAVGITLGTAVRWLQIHRYVWAPGREPDTPLRRAQQAVAAETLLVLDAERERRGSSEGGD